MLFGAYWNTQNNPKIIVFIDFWSLLMVLESLELFYVNLLIKTYLLVPNLCLYDLAFKNEAIFGSIFVKNWTRKVVFELFNLKNTLRMIYLFF